MQVLTNAAFQAFEQADVPAAMQAIRKYIQPVLRREGMSIKAMVEASLNLEELPIHVAKHIRRKVSLPFNTWVALGGDYRGYKQYIHLQLGINHQYVFAVIAAIDHPRFEQEVIATWQQAPQLLNQLGSDFQWIEDHTQLPYHSLSQVALSNLFQRPYQRQKADILIGRILTKGDPRLEDTAQFHTWVMETFQALLPLYALSQDKQMTLRAEEKRMGKTYV